MKLRLVGHNDRYALEQLQMSLFADEPMEPCDAAFSGDGAVSKLFSGETWLTATACITYHGKTACATRRLAAAKQTVPLRRRILQQSYYLAAVKLLSCRPAWGALAGVRPTKLTTRHLLSGGTAKSAAQLMQDTYYVTEARSRLCVDASLFSVQAAAQLRKRDLSVYVGIPFCPSRCAYCSFVSQTTGKSGSLLAPYLDCLIREIEYTGQLLKKTGRTVRTLYMGGGTPTTLSTEQLERLMQAISDNFDLSQCLEYTVEGGRPDTLDLPKLRAIYAHGCRRMSINPQTMNDAVLKAVGRPHSAQQTVDAYLLAQQAGFTHINMDLIAGLPGETPQSFADSLARVIALAPSNITVHTLALKKGADFFKKRGGLATDGDVAQMVDGACAALRQAGYAPYYLYRQKYMSGSFENVGWCRNNDSCLYNIYMMEELHSIVSLGGGAMSKVQLSETKLERFHNPKFPSEYITQFGDVLVHKDDFFRLLSAQERNTI